MSVGVLYAEAGIVPFSGLTASIERHNYPGFDWRADVPHIHLPILPVYGQLTDTAPVEVVHWMVSGVRLADGMEPWGTCITMLSRL